MNERIYDSWTIYRNRNVYWRPRGCLGTKEEWDKAKRLSYFERIASKDAKADWRAEIVMGLRDATYQRQGKNRWVLVKSGMGYA